MSIAEVTTARLYNIS